MFVTIFSYIMQRACHTLSYMDTPRNKPLDQLTETDLVKVALGDVIVRLRYERGFGYRSERKLSRVVGISNSHLRSIEEGAVSPSVVTLWKIASVLEIEPSDILTETRRLLDLSPRILLEYDPRKGFGETDEKE